MDTNKKDEIIEKILKDFLSVRTIITLGTFIVAYRIIWIGGEVPELLKHIIDLLLGYWFGSKIAKLTQKKEG